MLESEIDASLDRLELEGPTGTSLPGSDAFVTLGAQASEAALTDSLAGTGETLVHDSVVPSTAEQTGRGTRPPIAFNVGVDEATQSAQIMPHTMRDSFRAGRDPLATDRPLDGGNDSFHPPPVTVPGGPMGDDEAGETGESPVTQEEELGSGELEDVEEHTGVGTQMDRALESTLAARKTGGDGEDDDIVIADDLAEEVEDDTSTPGHDDEEHTDAGGTVPPFRPGN